MLDLVCIICHESLAETSDVCATLCGHIFHISCISTWLRDSRTCPQCRKACTNSSIYKLYIDAAVETSGNTKAQLSAKNSALDLYEELNLNLKRDLEVSESSLALCQARLIDLEDIQTKVKNELQDEIKRRETSEKRVTELERDKTRLIELDQSLQEEYIRVQNDLRREIEKRTTNNQEIEELRKDKLHLKSIVHRLQLENLRLQNDLEIQSKRKGTTEERMAELEKRVEKEIEEREKREKQTLSQVDERNDLAAEAVLFGVPQLPGENLKSIFRKLCQAIECTLPNLKDIYRSRPLNKNDSPIILKFVSSNERNGILKALSEYQKRINRKLSSIDLGFFELSNRNIYMRENLSSENRALLQQALRMKRNNQLASVYTNFGAVYVKENADGISKKIENQDMLNGIAPKKNIRRPLLRAPRSSSSSVEHMFRAESRDDLNSFLDFDD